MKNNTPLSVKKHCLDMKASGYKNKDIYNNYYVHAVDEPCGFEAFRRKLVRWSGTEYPDDMTLSAGTYEGFTAHGATVQVNAQGEIVQAWIKEHADNFDPEAFVEALKGNVEKYEPEPVQHQKAKDLLEIPLFDMHWGIADLSYYTPVLDRILEIVRSQTWRRIYIPFGQDFFHNDSIVKGETTKGTKIEKVDMVKAVKDGKKFICAIVEEAIRHADHVSVVYSPGNHDKSISWMFMQMLLERYGAAIVDDRLLQRRAFLFGKSAVMITHGDSKNASTKNLAHIFPVEFPKEFSSATTREVHAGHLHGESGADIYGVMVRRLSTGGKTDEWSDGEDLVGKNKRFMLFDWGEDGLRSIFYV